MRAKPRRAGWASRLAALGLVLAFGITAYAGANILAVEYLERNLRRQPRQPVDEVLRTLAPWKDTVAVGARARRVALDIVVARTPGDAAAIEGALDEIVKNSPTSVAIWQVRVTYQKARGAPMETVLAGFRMSALTGPQEGSAMKRRAMFGLTYWTELQEADRRIVVRDVLGIVLSSKPDRDDLQPYRAILAKRSETEQDEIRNRLTAFGLVSRDAYKALGL